MNKLNFKVWIATLEARKLQERVLLLAVVVVIIFMSWLTFVFDPLNADQASLERQITIVDNQIITEENKYREIQSTYSDDPNAFARSRRAQLQTATMELDERLNQLYGQLILPRQMAIVLTSILQRETSLKLVNLQNVGPEALISASISAAVPLVGEAARGIISGNNSTGGLQVYRHGLRLDFEGDYLETIRYLRSLEALDTNFFWDTLTFDVVEYPRARISLNIFTLSTQEDFIGV